MPSDSVPLKEHLLALRALDKVALDAALAAANERFAAHNGLLDRMRERDATYASREAVDAQLGALREKIEALSLQQQAVKGRDSGISTAWLALGGLVALAAAAVSVYAALRPR